MDYGYSVVNSTKIKLDGFSGSAVDVVGVGAGQFNGTVVASITVPPHFSSSRWITSLSLHSYRLWQTLFWDFSLAVKCVVRSTASTNICKNEQLKLFPSTKKLCTLKSIPRYHSSSSCTKKKVLNLSGIWWTSKLLKQLTLKSKTFYSP